MIGFALLLKASTSVDLSSSSSFVLKVPWRGSWGAKFLKAGRTPGFLHVTWRYTENENVGRTLKGYPVGANLYIHVFPSHDVFLAITQTGKGSYYGRRLEGLGRYILDDLKGSGVDLDDVEFSLSADLLPSYALCSRCSGKGRVDAPGTVAAQYLASEFDKIDFAKTGTQTCPICRGMGVVIPGFF